MRKLKIAPPVDAPRLVWTVEEARAQLGIGRSTMQRLVLSGALRTITIGRRRLVSVQAVETFLRQREEQGGDAA